MRIGFIGFGEAAFNISLGLGQEGLENILAFDAMLNHAVMGQQVKSRAKQANVSLVATEEDLIHASDIVFAAVPSSYTLDVCEKAKKVLRKDQIYADVSASTPDVKKQIWQTLASTGVLFVDAAMLGSLPQDKHKVPITASGNGAERLKEIMSPYGMNITCVGGGAGAASAIKLVRSVFMKGIAALMIETMQGADAYQVTDEIIASISKSMDGIPFTKHLDRLITGTAIHAKRRSSELSGAIEMLQEANLSACMTKSSKEKHDAMAQYNFQQRYIDAKPAGQGEIIELMKQAKGE